MQDNWGYLIKCGMTGSFFSFLARLAAMIHITAEWEKQFAETFWLLKSQPNFASFTGLELKRNCELGLVVDCRFASKRRPLPMGTTLFLITCLVCYTGSYCSSRMQGLGCWKHVPELISRTIAVSVPHLATQFFQEEEYTTHISSWVAKFFFFKFSSKQNDTISTHSG